jgi:esterase/lipase superfamily enzyme
MARAAATARNTEESVSAATREFSFEDKPAAPAARAPASGDPAGGGAPAAAVSVQPAAASPSPAANVCQDKKVCTPVGVFFGTDRAPEQKETRVVFAADRADTLTLGHAFVTVPKARKTGEIPIPSLWDIYVRRVPEAGDPARHFTIPPGGVSVYASEDDFISAVKQHMANAGEFKDHAFVFIHGFRVAFDEALFRTAQIAYDLSGDGVPFGTAFLYSWPSAADATAYLFDEDSARLAIPHLEKFLKLVIDKTGAKHVHLIAHSMGNVPLINALKTVTTTENAHHINQIVLAAPDFDKKEFEKVIAGIAPVAEGITLYASSTDYAMKIARRARRVPRAGDATTPPGPAIASGFETVDVSAIDTSIFSWNHNHYAESKELLTDMSKIFRTGQRPPPARNGSFKPQTSEAGLFWRYQK